MLFGLVGASLLANAGLIVAVVLLRRKISGKGRLDELDKSFDAAIAELDKMGNLIRRELDAKHKEIVFLCDLAQDRHKEISEAGETAKLLLERLAEVAAEQKRGAEIVSAQGFSGAAPEATVDRAKLSQSHASDVTEIPSGSEFFRRTSNPVHRRVLELFEAGRETAFIAKELGMGQGEVALILNLAGKQA